FETGKSSLELRLEQHKEYKNRKKYPQIFDYLVHKSIIFAKKTMTKSEFITFQGDFNNCLDFFIKPEVVFFLDQK
mgnify:CR=1